MITALTAAKKDEKKSQLIKIENQEAENYINTLIKLIEGGRINKFFPDSACLINLLSFLKPSLNYNLYSDILINPYTGFVAEKDITRVAADWQLSRKTLQGESLAQLEQKYKDNPTPVNERRIRTYKYHRDLSQKPILPLINIDTKLRSLDTEKYIAYFNIVLDRYDLAASLFVRYTIVAGQEDPAWQMSQVVLEKDELKYTKGFRNLISKYCTNESEFAFILLNDLKNVVVEEVQRCRIGPLYFKGVKLPEGMEPLFEKYPDAFVLSFPTDRTSIYIKEDKNDDPLAVMYRDSLDLDAKTLRDRKADLIGYHVYKERKFACSRNMLSDFRKFLKEKNARCVVYGV